MLLRRRSSVAIAIAALCCAAGCSSSKRAASPTSTTTASVPATAKTGSEPFAHGHFEMREVQYSASNALVFPFSTKPVPSTSTQPTPGTTGARAFPGCAALIAQSPRDAAKAPQVVLPDRTRKFCYVLGPTLLTGADVGSASVVYDSTNSQWAVNVQFANDHFLTKIAQPLIGKEVAMVLNGLVVSAPVINPGITGRVVEVTGNFSRAEAIAAAAAIGRVQPSAVRVQSG